MSSMFYMYTFLCVSSQQLHAQVRMEVQLPVSAVVRRAVQNVQRFTAQFSYVRGAGVAKAARRCGRYTRPC